MLEKIWEYSGRIHKLFIDFEKACNSMRREILDNIVIEFCVRMKLVKLIKICLNETFYVYWITVSESEVLFEVQV
jgi:hypothetical protein